MTTHDIRLLSASYSNTEDGTVFVELFGKTRDKRSITVLCYGYEPYFFIVDPIESTENVLKRDQEVVRLEHDRLLYRGSDHDVLRVTIKSPWKVPEYRNDWKRKGFDVLAADIPFHHRFVYDKDMGSCIRVTGEDVKTQYVTDLSVKMESFENIDSFDPGLKILSFDIENSIEHGYIYTICSVVEEDGIITECEPLVGSEKEIITKFGELIRTVDPDVITGYNIDNYDIRKIIERAQAVKLKDALPWGRDLGQPRLVNDRFWRLKGRIVVDAWWAVKRELRPKQETLNAVSKQILGETKLDVDPKHMDEEWKRDSAKVVKYCIKDAELALRVLLSVGTVRKGLDLGAVSKLPLDDAMNAGSSQLADSLLIRSADRHKIAVPLTGRRDTGSDQIEGGYVHTLNPGLYHWVCVLDFKSMYPSLIIAKNICFTTLSPNGDIISPSGARFLSPEKRVGLLPSILEDLMNERDRIKAQMKAAKDEKEKQYLDGLQAAVKILMNTFYGVFASSFYRFTDKNIGAAITAFARESVKTIIREVESEGISAIYSDTDSVFMQSPVHTLEGSIEFGKTMADRFSRDGGTLEFEKLLEPLFSHGKKKRYVGKVAWPSGNDELLVRGYEIRRSDSFDLQSRLLMELFEKILEEKNDEALALVKKAIQDTINKRVDPSELVISRSCKGMDAYENPERMSNVQAAKKLVEMGYDFIPGMKVSWIVTDGDRTPQQVEPYVSGAEFTAKPDYKYYAERLAQTASRITEVFGWSEKDLMLGSQQATLFDGAFDAPDRDKKEKPPVPQKPVVRKAPRLDDFF
ncbi:MAG: DNA polymerase II [Candidatus Methanoplasma sp.]|jgi:DNA polymerase I|nr:DNA polymerase II [Candidatus Methanoplasma sp.]